MKQMISCSLSKEFVFSRLLTGEKSKREETSWIYKLIFKVLYVFMKPVFVNSNTNCLRPNEIP